MISVIRLNVALNEKTHPMTANDNIYYKSYNYKTKGNKKPIICNSEGFCLNAKNRLWQGKKHGQSKARSLSSDVRVLNPDGSLKEIIPVAQCKELKPKHIVSEQQDILDNERRTPEYEEWRSKIIKRDKKTCVLCGSKEWIEVHHISRWIDDTDSRLRRDNGVCLCIVCHRKHHAPDNSPFPKEITYKLLNYINSFNEV